MTRTQSATTLVMALLGVLAACGDRNSTQRMTQAFQVGPTRPDEKPRVLNTELPFRYPAALYARRIQGKRRTRADQLKIWNRRQCRLRHIRALE